MRVIAGIAKGRKLVAPKGYKTRPTADRVKESLFNIIAGAVEGAAVLDLYAGSGSLAIEALSRGAGSAVMVDNDRAAIMAIKRNLAATGLADQAIVMNAPASRALAYLSRQNQAFDLILLDPPYKIEKAELEIVLGTAAGSLNKQGRIVVEHRVDLPELKLNERLELVGGRRYGDTKLSVYKEREK